MHFHRTLEHGHEAHLEYQRKAKAKARRKGLCRTCLKASAASGKSQCQQCLEKLRRREQKRTSELREQCIRACGGKCCCCGPQVDKYFQLDHVNDDGAEHKKLLTGNPRNGNMYRWAAKNGFPDNLQLLCCNCHQAKSYFGGCAEEDHKRMKSLS